MSNTEQITNSTSSAHKGADSETKTTMSAQVQQDPNKEEESTRVNMEQSQVEEAERERDNYRWICRLLVELGPQAMHKVFNNIHSQINLSETLARPAINTQLRRLRAMGLINATQWDILYPQRKSQINVSNYDPTLLFLLLRNICSLAAPYPDGWHGLPLQADASLSADLVRIQWFRTLLMGKKRDAESRMTDKEYQAYWKQIRDIIVRLGGVSVKVKLERLERKRSGSLKNRKLDNEDMEQYSKQLNDWDNMAKTLTAKETQIERMRNRDGNDLSQLTSDSFAEYSAGSQSKTPDTQSQVMDRTSGNKSTKQSGNRKQNSRRKSHNYTREVKTLTKEELRAHERTVLLKFYRQLTETVDSDDIVPKLIQRGLLSHEEKNRISLSTRNADRMKMVLELLSKKTGNIFDKFCDAIKYKYKKLFDQLVKAKESPLKMEKPDELSQCRAALQSVYNQTLKTIAPIPWHSELSANILDFVLPYHITDFYGRTVNQSNLLSPHSKCEKPTRILLEGLDGVGKSTLLHHLAYQWANGTKGTFLDRYKLVFYLDLKKVTGDLMESLLDQCLGPGGYIRTVQEIQTMLGNNEQDTLFLLDGYEDINNIDTNLWDLVHQNLFRRSTIIMATNTRFITSSLLKNFDTQLVLLGLKPDTQEDLVRRYAELTQTSMETYAGLLTKVISEYNTTIRTYSLNPLYGMCLCLISETGGNIDFHTNTFMMNSVLCALQKLYCQQNHLEMSEEAVPDDVKNVVNILEQIAFQKILENNLSVSYREILEATEGKGLNIPGMVIKLGLFEFHDDSTAADGSVDDKMYSFVNRFFQEYFAARYLSRVEPEEFYQHIEGLVSEKHLHKVTAFFCGIHRYDYNLRTMRELFKALAEVNMKSGIMSRRSSTRDGVVLRGEGRLSSVSLCLECLAESEGRRDIMEILENSFPWRLFMKHRIHHSPLSIIGLSQVLKSNMASVSELELRLDHVGMYYDHFLMVLADAIEKNTQLTTLKIRWTREDLLAMFLVNVFGENKSLRHLHIIDESQSHQDEVSATVWSNLWSAGNNMTHLQTLAFMQCHNPAIVTSFIRNSPANLQNLYLNACKIDLIGSQELASKIEKNKSLRLLSLSSSKLKRSDFLNLSYGLKLNKSLTELIMTDFTFDEESAAALSEALKFNHTIKRLDIRKVTLSTESCRMLGHALGINPSILEVDLKDTLLTEDGARLLRKLKRDGVLLTGIKDRGLLGNSKYLYDPQFTESLVLLPAIKT